MSVPSSSSFSWPCALTLLPPFLQTDLDAMNIMAGIKQDCPLNSAPFALFVDPLVRAHLAHITFTSSRICHFVDGVALGLAIFETSWAHCCSTCRVALH